MEHQTLGFGGSVELSLTPPVTSAGPTPSQPFCMHTSHIRAVIVWKRRADSESLLLDSPSNWSQWMHEYSGFSTEIPLTLIRQDSDSSRRTKRGLWGLRGSRISLRELSIIAWRTGEKSNTTLPRDVNKKLCNALLSLNLCLNRSLSGTESLWWYETQGKQGGRYFSLLMVEEKQGKTEKDGEVGC